MLDIFSDWWGLQPDPVSALECLEPQNDRPHLVEPVWGLLAEPGEDRAPGPMLGPEEQKQLLFGLKPDHWPARRLRHRARHRDHPVMAKLRSTVTSS